jgi:hypothetical protein
VAASLDLPQRKALETAITDLLRRRGSRLLGVREIFERLDE